MLLVDTVQGRVIDDQELKEEYAARQPYGEWLNSQLVNLSDLKIPNQKVPQYSRRMPETAESIWIFLRRSEDFYFKYGNEWKRRNRSHGYRCTVLSEQHQSLFGYFKQLFAQVTNPPIDAIREKIVTSTTVYVGEEGNLLEQKRKIVMS